jgi:hypothetical protein
MGVKEIHERRKAGKRKVSAQNCKENPSREKTFGTERMQRDLYPGFELEGIENQCMAEWKQNNEQLIPVGGEKSPKVGRSRVDHSVTRL